MRKGVEGWLTVYLSALAEEGFSRSHVNVAELGPGIYGLEAASRRYFRKPAAQLLPHEAALLAAVLPNPEHMSAGKPSAYAPRAS